MSITCQGILPIGGSKQHWWNGIQTKMTPLILSCKAAMISTLMKCPCMKKWMMKWLPLSCVLRKSSLLCLSLVFTHIRYSTCTARMNFTPLNNNFLLTCLTFMNSLIVLVHSCDAVASHANRKQLRLMKMRKEKRSVLCNWLSPNGSWKICTCRLATGTISL